MSETPARKSRRKATPAAAPQYFHVLRTCNADMTSYGGFVWPQSGHVEAPDWCDDGECGHGLHGFLRGEGDGDLASWAADAKWLVVRVRADDVRDMGAKVKFPRGEVVFCGDRLAATSLIATLHPEARAIVGYTATAGDNGTATAGDYGTATAGYRGTATAGDSGTLTIRWYDARRRLAVAYVGEDGIEPGVAYRLTQDGKFVKADR